MFCTSCGADLGTRSSKFCQYCGAILKTQAPASSPVHAVAAAPPEPVSFAGDDIPSFASITIDSIASLECGPVTTPPPRADDLEPPVVQTQTTPDQDAAPAPVFTTPQPSPPEAQSLADPGSERKDAESCPQPEASPTPLTTNWWDEPAVRGGENATARTEAVTVIPSLIPPSDAAPERAAPAGETLFSNTSTFDVPTGVAGWTERYTTEISALGPLAESGRIEPTIGGGGKLPDPAPLSPPRPTVGAAFAVTGIAIILVAALAGGAWWTFSQTNAELDPSSEETPEASFEAPPRQPVEAPTVQATDAPQPLPEFDPESTAEQEPEAALMDIPSLPANQQQGRHNRSEIDILESPPPPQESSPSAALPLPAARTPSTAPAAPIPPPRAPATPTPPRATAIPIPPPRPPAAPLLRPMPLPSPPAPAAPLGQTPVRIVPPPVMAPTPAPKPAAPPSPATASRQQPTPESPPWLGRLRREMENCENFFCRERVRERYCSERWENLPECRSASL